MSKHHTHLRHDHEASKRTTLIRRGLWGLAALLVVAGCVIVGGKWLEAKESVPQQHGDLSTALETTKTITVGDSTYRLRKNITSILVLGVDRDSSEAVNGFRNGGQADFLLLLVLDEAQKRIIPLQIDRDTMTEITILGILGNDAGTRSAQICLSHGFGDGASQSSLLTASAVSKLLLGTDIDFHVAMNMDGISDFNDALGGIEVTLADDFSALDPMMTRGTTLTLHGKQAEYFVRSRTSIGVGTNEARQQRQQDYLSAAKTALDAKLQKSSEFIGVLFDSVEAYLETDMKRGRMINIAWNTRSYTREPIRQLAGEHFVGDDGFMEFRADPQALQALVLEIFYEQVS